MGVLGEQGPGDLREGAEKLNWEGLRVEKEAERWALGEQGFLEKGLGALGEESPENSFLGLRLA